MNLGIIVAASINDVIGLDGKIPWKISQDLRRFKVITQGHPVIMGRKTYESLPKKPLSERPNIVLSSQNINFDGAKTVSSLESALDYCHKSFPGKRPYVIGGSSVYEEALKIADILELTRVNLDIKGNAYLPKINFQHWILVSNEKRTTRHIDYSFQTYVRNKGFSD